jgi:large subunit ribosomal protein L20
MGYQHAYKDRKIFKRTQRSLWIARLNAFARALGMNYSRLIDGAKKIGLSWNRKTLSEFAVNSYMNSDGGFEKLVAKIREAGA